MENKFIEACSNGDVLCLTDILHTTTISSYIIQEGTIIACKNNNINIIEYLIKFNNVNNYIFDNIQYKCSYLLMYLIRIAPMSEIKTFLFGHEIQSTIHLTHRTQNYIVDKYCKYAFIISCENGNINMTDFLIEYCKKNNIIIEHDLYSNVLHNLCSTGELEMIKYITKYIDENNIIINTHKLSINFFLIAYFNGHLTTMKYLIEYFERHNIKVNFHINDLILLTENSNLTDELINYMKYICVHNYGKLNFIYNSINSINNINNLLTLKIIAYNNKQFNSIYITNNNIVIDEEITIYNTDYIIYFTK